MISCIEIALKPSLRDAEASSLIKKATSYFGIQIQTARTVHILVIDSDLKTKIWNGSGRRFSLIR